MGFCHNKQLKSLSRDEWEVLAMAILLPPLSHDEGVPGNAAFMKAWIEVKSQVISGVGVWPTLQIDGKPNDLKCLKLEEEESALQSHCCIPLSIDAH